MQARVAPLVFAGIISTTIFASLPKKFITEQTVQEWHRQEDNALVEGLCTFIRQLHAITTQPDHTVKPLSREEIQQLNDFLWQMHNRRPTQRLTFRLSPMQTTINTVLSSIQDAGFVTRSYKKQADTFLNLAESLVSLFGKRFIRTPLKRKEFHLPFLTEKEARDSWNLEHEAIINAECDLFAILYQTTHLGQSNEQLLSKKNYNDLIDYIDALTQNKKLPKLNQSIQQIGTHLSDEAQKINNSGLFRYTGWGSKVQDFLTRAPLYIELFAEPAPEYPIEKSSVAPGFKNPPQSSVSTAIKGQKPL